jgi:hypothetical protein
MSSRHLEEWNLKVSCSVIVIGQVLVLTASLARKEPPIPIG